MCSTTESKEHNYDTHSSFISIENALPQWNQVSIKGFDERLMLNGQVSNDLDQRLIVLKKKAFQTEKAVGIKVYGASTGKLLSLLEAQPEGGIKIKSVFPSSQLSQ